MATEAKCGNCKHRGARSICTEPLSPYGGKRVEPDERCDYFLENPAEEHFAKGIAASLYDDQTPAEIDELEKAIAEGLPEDNEMQARYFLGSAYRQMAWRAGLPVEQMVRTPEFERALSEQEKALRMDRSGDYGYFVQPVGRALVGSFDLLCVLRSRRIAGEQGQEAATAFLEEKVRLCDYLPTSPLLQTLLELGNIYAEGGAKDRAVACYERIINAEPVLKADEEGVEAEARAMAANNLRIITSPEPARSTGSGCMLILTVLGLTLVGTWSIWIFS